jgi:hypothetical protein
MESLKNAAVIVSSYSYADDTKKQFDPLTILMIISIIISLTKLIQQCKLNNQEVKDKANTMNYLEKMQVKRRIKKFIRKNKYPDKDEGKILDGLKSVCYNSSEDEIGKILQEAKENGDKV